MTPPRPYEFDAARQRPMRVTIEDLASGDVASIRTVGNVRYNQRRDYCDMFPRCTLSFLIDTAPKPEPLPDALASERDNAIVDVALRALGRMSTSLAELEGEEAEDEASTYCVDCGRALPNACSNSGYCCPKVRVGEAGS